MEDTKESVSIPVIAFVDRAITQERLLTDTKMAAIAKALELAQDNAKQRDENQRSRTNLLIGGMGLVLTAAGIVVAILHFWK